MLEDLLDTLVTDLETQSIVDEISSLHTRVFDCIVSCLHDPASITEAPFEEINAAAFIAIVKKFRPTPGREYLKILPFDDESLIEHLAYAAKSYDQISTKLPEPPFSAISCEYGHPYNPNYFKRCPSCAVYESILSDGSDPYSPDLWQRFVKVIFPDA